MKSFILKAKGLFARRDQNDKENGFNMLEIVIGVGIILILSVGGILTYNNITKNAKIATVEDAASQVYQAAVTYDIDADNETNFKDAETEYMASQNGDKKIIVTVTKQAPVI